MYKDVRYWGFSWKSDPAAGSRHDFGEGEVTLMNPLHGRILVAKTLAKLHRTELVAHGIGAGDPYTIADALESESHLVDAPEETRLTQLEQDAVAAACKNVHERGETLVYMNDFARLKHGFDLVAEDVGEKVTYIEVKGTLAEVAEATTDRLRQTKHKGRQLSQRWIWRSLEATALFSVSASFFLKYARRSLDRDYRRRLVVVSLGSGSKSVACVEENVLASCSGLSDEQGIDQARRWLSEIDRVEPDLI